MAYRDFIPGTEADLVAKANGFAAQVAALTPAAIGLTPAQLRTFVQGAGLFGHAFDEHEGLGPLYNAESCASCHAAGGAGGPGHQEVQRMGLADTRQADWAVRGTGFYAMSELGGPIRQGKVVGGGSEPLPTAKDVDALAKRLAAHGINAGRTVIRSGLAAGDKVVTAGAYALKARVLKSQISSEH